MCPLLSSYNYVPLSDLLEADSFTFGHTEGGRPAYIVPLNSEAPATHFGHGRYFQMDVPNSHGELQVFYVGSTANCMEEGERHLTYKGSTRDPTKMS